MAPQYPHVNTIYIILTGAGAVPPCSAERFLSSRGRQAFYLLIPRCLPSQAAGQAVDQTVYQAF